ncbi:NrsF family protein [Erythrobacter sp. NE805]|uniref:NrsF family protein n=1 Tax=Erythrobacter sp. NE805 TaxID=3389875 RepID=UPI00396B3259
MTRMTPNSDALIAELVGDLEPVKPLHLRSGLAGVLGAAGLSAAAVIVLLGARPDWVLGSAEPMHLVATGLFAGLALAASVTVIVMGRPQVGTDHGGWRWAAGMAALLPLAALIVAVARGRAGVAHEVAGDGAECLVIGAVASLLVFAMLTAWLRRGAPTAPGRAGLVAGVAAGAFGSFAVSLHCPDNDIVHIGMWHASAVVVMAALGRAVIPRLVRW